MEKKYFDQSNRLNEGKKVILKRRYTEKYPAITAGRAARIRNKMLEAIADGKISQEEFNTMLSELSANSRKWMTRNTKYFNVSEDGISLSRFGKRALNQIKINENTEMENFMFESFSEFINEDSAEKLAQQILQDIAEEHGEDALMSITREEIEETIAAYNIKGRKADKVADYIISMVGESVVNEGYVKTRGYKETEDRIERLMSSLRPDSMLCKSISKKADNVTSEFKEMQKYMNEIMSIWQEVEYTIAMSSKYESVEIKTSDILCEATVTMDAMAPDDRNFLKWLGKNKVEIIDTVKSGPMGHPEITMQGKRKDLEKVLADCKWGWCDEDLAEYIEESVELNEAFKSSKLRNLVNMDQSGSDAYGKSKNLAAGLYGLSKIKLDQVEDHALVDMDAMDAYKKYANNKDYVVFYIVDNEKHNPHADHNSYRKPILKPGILALSRGKDFLGVEYNQYDSRGYNDLRGKKIAYSLGKSDDGVGGNKKYRGYDASGISSIIRAAKLSDRAIVFNLVAGGESSRDLIQQRADAQSGAIAFKSDKDFKKANMQRYKDILAAKASKMPLDKMVEDAINMLTKHISDAMKSGAKTKYNEIKIGEDKRGREIKITDASNIMSGILGDYERYVKYMADAEREKDSGYSSGYYEKESKEYAKRVSDKVKKIKNMDYAW